MMDQSEKSIRLLWAALLLVGAGFLLAAAVFRQLAWWFLLIWTALSIGLSAFAFARIRRQVNQTMERVDETIAALVDGRRTDDFDPNADTLLGKFQTQIMALYQILEATRQREKTLRQQMESSVSDLVHQLNTPITNIALYGDFLLNEDLTEEERRHCTRAIVSQTEKLGFLGEGFAKISRLENDIIHLKPAAAPLLPVVLQAIDQVQAKAAAHGNTIVLLGDQQLICQMDSKWTGEALYNLLDNAVKYSDPDTAITVSMAAYDIFVRVDVLDRGLILAQEDYAKVFQRFYRANEAADKNGVGLGLYLAREIIRGQGGYIKAGQSPDGQMCFSLFLLK